MLPLITLAQLAVTQGPKVLRFAKKFLPVGEREKKALDAVANVVELAGGDTKKAESGLKELPEEDRLAFAEVMNDHAESIEEIRANIVESVNKTMRVEAQSDKWWVSGWRPFWGFMSALAFLAQVSAIVYVMFTNGDPELINSLSALSMFWSVPLAVVGVSAYTRGKEKEARLKG